MKNEILMQARRKLGLTQEELASLLGYSKASVSNWENGYSNPTLSDAFRISEILGEDINVLFLGLRVQVECTKGRNQDNETEI